MKQPHHHTINQAPSNTSRHRLTVVYRWLRISCLLILTIGLPSTVWGQTINGFDLSTTNIPVIDIFPGGPPRDGIPAINQPQFVPVDDVDYLRDDDIVIGLFHNGIARAYPTRILIWHEIVNDTIGDQAVAVTYCPLCGTAMVFDREVNGQLKTFGVSGLLYQSDVLLYDQEEESLWSQLAMKAVSGPAIGQTLTWLSSEHSTWQTWREKHPDGQVLSTETGYQRHYAGNAYADYFATDETMFPVPKTRTELANKDWVIGILINGEASAYPVSQLPPNQPIYDNVGQQSIIIHYDADKQHPQVTQADNTPIPSVMAFWFAWQAFYPETRLWQP